MSLESGQLAPLPDFPLPDAEGVGHNLKEVLHNGPVLLGIYKSSCASSKQMFPMLERIHHRHAGQPLSVIGVSQDSANITRSFARRYGISFPLLVEGPEFPVSRAFEIAATPTIFLIEPEGTISYTTMGFLKPGLDAMADSVADALGLPHEPLISDADADLPMFVPG